MYRKRSHISEGRAGSDMVAEASAVPTGACLSVASPGPVMEARMEELAWKL